MSDPLGHVSVMDSNCIPCYTARIVNLARMRITTMSEFQLVIRDSTDETARSEWFAGDLTAASLPGALTDWNTLRGAIQAVITGVQASDQWGDSTVISTTVPTAADCQRGIKWNVLLSDNVTGIKSTRKIPTANLSLLPLVGGKRQEDLDLTAGAGLALKNAIQGFARSNVGNAVTVLRVYYAD